ncbi:transposase [Deinococcus sp. Leaf326]|nr:transposase [Deinococcus sp. Leaf326]
MSTSQPLWERARILTDRLLAVPPTAYQQRSLGAAFCLFLNPEVKTVLHQAESVSASALSRFFNEYNWDTTVCWMLLGDAQWDLLLQTVKRKHHPCLRLRVDLTSVPKTGRQLPFVRGYNEVYGSHLVILFAHYGTLKFPVGYRVYRSKGTPTPVTLARDLLRTVPHTIRTRFRVRVLADSGFEAAALLDEVRMLGFKFVVGIRSTRRTAWR